jgi:hypothetical protein
MNRLKLVINPCADRPDEYQPVDICIDDVSLIGLLKRVERPDAEREGHPDLAGSYGSLSTGTTFFPSRHFLGEPRALLDHQGKTALLICTCGCEGCWDFVCRISVSEQTVTWSDFEQVHRQWDYSELGTFVFDRRQYESELGFPLYCRSSGAE